MKIGIVLSQTPGYSETFFRSKIKGLQKSGMEVFLYVQKEQGNFDLCPIFKSPKISANSVFQVFFFLKEFLLLLPYASVVRRFILLEQNEGTRGVALLKKVYLNSHLLKAKLDWLHYGFATQALGRETLAKAIGAKMAVSFRGFDMAVYPVKNPGCYYKLWKYVDKIHSISEYLLSKAVYMGLSMETPWAIINPAVSFDNFHRNTNYFPSKEIKIFTIARPNSIKGLDISIEAMRLLKECGIKFKYYIIGDKESHDAEPYKFMVYELGLTEEVVFLGEQSHQKSLDYLTTADLYIQPSLNEGFCNAVLEAQSQGILCIVSNAGGLSENVLHEKTGWVVPKYSPELLAEQIKKVILMDLEEKTKISTNAMSRVRKDFNVEKQEKEFVEFYS